MSAIARAVVIVVIATVLLVAFVVATLAGAFVLILLWVMRAVAVHPASHG